ncbi:MAG: hypothetical protein KAW90_04945 [Dehalococcoidales bacterium]|nr:hypothetical protein [Dehalococcoidales bacterium]
MSLRQLREKLDKGFYVDNLCEMARLCKDMALESDSPVPFFIMQKIFSGIADYWDDRPVIVEEAKLVEAELLKSLNNLIDVIEDNASADQLMTLINKVISSYLFLYG